MRAVIVQTIPPYLMSRVLKVAKNYPIFLSYFTKQVAPVYGPGIEKDLTQWTNNNCESINHILKLDAKWTPATTPELIEMLHQVTVLHFRDFRRALYGEGNYRLVKRLKKRYSISKESWRKFSESEKDEKFRKCLENKQKVANVVKSTSNFMIQKCGVVTKPGQKKRIKGCRTSGRR